MAGRRPKLTPELQHEVVTYIANGAYDYVAAQAAGISRSTYYRWYNAGANPKSRYAAFRRAVDEARSRARVVAETRVFKEKPDVWLKNGPGRERAGQPGWTHLVRPWSDDIDREALQASAQQLATRLGLEAAELLQLAESIARRTERIRVGARNPDLFLEGGAG